MILGLVVALLLLIAGGLGVLAARHTQQPGLTGAEEAETGRSTSARLAELVHAGLGRTAQAVDVHVERRPVEELAQERVAPADERRTTLAVIGGGLLALGAVMAVGVILLFG